MKRYQNIIAFVLCLMGSLFENFYSKGYAEELLLKDLITESDKYAGKKITMRLKLKYVDWLLGKVYFYDKKNFDIAFDITIQSEMQEYQNEMRALREGMDFEVTFLFNGIGSVGTINAELIKFVPTILYKLPEGIGGKNELK